MVEKDIKDSVDKNGNDIEDELGYDALSFGRYLRALRLEKGIKIESVAAETRINIKTLRLIEAEDHDGLPDEVFVKGFLRSYSEMVGANPDETVQRYLANCHVRRQAARFERDLIRSGERFWSRLLLSLGALACIITVTLALTTKPETPMPMTQGSQPATPTVAPAEAAPETPAAAAREAPVVAVAPEAPKTPAPEKANRAEALSLAVVAVLETWMKIIIDDQPPKAYVLHPGDNLEFTAQEGINLLIGNAAGVKLRLNDAALPVPGKPGQVTTLQLP